MTVTFLAVISYPPIPIFEVGPLRMSLHGLFAGIGFLAGAYYGTRLYRNRGFDAALFQSVLTWALVGSLLGARWLTLPAYWIENGFD
ncbi:MAG: prolipoprotein diacylglyceryl transferase, partial [Acidimicrobiia bacterium]|nr:prolipoprotein diacylglyceryl transferase [Acidimicrobiia bacterium]